MKLIVICNRPGLIRGGRRNPDVAEYTDADFSLAQMDELLAEPAITVVYGVRLHRDLRLDAATELAREALAISVGLNLDGLGDAVARAHPADTAIAGPGMEQGTDLAVAGALQAVTEADTTVRHGRRRA